MIQSLSEMDDHLSRRDSYMATAGANNRKIFSKNKYIASKLCFALYQLKVLYTDSNVQFELSRQLKLPKCISRPFLSCFVSIKKFLQKIQIHFYPAKIKLLIFLVSKILFLLMERCTIRVLMLMQCNSPKGCWRFQGFSSISTSILA